MNKVGSILGLFVSQIQKKHRQKKDMLALDNKGVIGDKFYNKDIKRSVLIASTSSYTLMKNQNIVANYGDLGENILIDFNPYSLTPGERLKIGESVVLEISQYCTICNHLSSIDNKVPNLLKNDRGIFAKVITPGIIAQGNDIWLS